MGQEAETKPLTVYYDDEQDVLYLSFTREAREGIAEEAGDEVFVRYNPLTKDIINVEFLNFRGRLVDVFGPDLKYLGTERPERLILPQ
jgi:uncharacterized protein YuzE